MQDIVLFTSNCFGEDRSAALIARELVALGEPARRYRVMGASLISDGRDYTSRGIPLLFSSAVPPSGGFPTHSVRGFLADLFSGSITTVFRFVKTLRSHAREIRVGVVVGDVALLILTRWALPHTPLVFLSLPKSDYIAPHYAIELWYITRHASHFLTRDAYTAANLQQKGIPALFLGNPIMDDLDPVPTPFVPSEKPVVGLLPGSREEAYANFALMLPIIEAVDQNIPCTFIAALPSTLTDERLALVARQYGWEYRARSPFPLLSRGSTSVVLSRGIFASVLHLSTVVLGLAGTANEQAAGLGKPVVAFRGRGPQTTARRFREQQRLLGDALSFQPDYPDGVIREILFLLQNPEERSRRGGIGQTHMGSPGGSRAIASLIASHYLEEISHL